MHPQSLGGTDKKDPNDLIGQRDNKQIKGLSHYTPSPAYWSDNL